MIWLNLYQAQVYQAPLCWSSCNMPTHTYDKSRTGPWLLQPKLSNVRQHYPTTSLLHLKQLQTLFWCSMLLTRCLIGHFCIDWYYRKVGRIWTPNWTRPSLSFLSMSTPRQKARPESRIPSFTRIARFTGIPRITQIKWESNIVPGQYWTSSFSSARRSVGNQFVRWGFVSNKN